MWINSANGTYVFDGDESLTYPISGSFIRAFEVIACAFLLSVCVAGNSLVLYVIYRHRRMRTITNYLLGNLASADLCMAFFHTGPNLYLLIVEDWIFGTNAIGQGLCMAYSYLRSVSYHGSIHVLMLIATERFLAIVHPFGSRCFLLSKTALRLSVLAAWLLSFLVSVPIGIFSVAWSHVYMRHDGVEVNQTMCIRKGYSDGAIHWPAYDIFVFFLWFVLPLITMIIFYILVGIKLWKRAELRQRRGGKELSVMTYQTRLGSMRPEQKNLTDENTVKNRTSVDPAIEVDGSDQSSSVRTNSLGSKKSLSVVINLAADKEGDGGDMAGNTDPLMQHPDVLPEMLIEMNRRKKRRAGSGWLSSINSSTGSVSPDVIEERRRVIRALVVMVLVFFVCWLPMHVRKLLFHTVSYNFWHGYLPGLTDWLVVIHGTLNPIIYAFFSSRFRECVREVLYRHPGRDNAFYRQRKSNS